LLATTCLSVACGASASAGTITLTPGAQSTPLGALLPVGTTTVDGFVGELPFEGGFNPRDWFEFQGLTPGSSYNLTAVYDPLGPFEVSGNGESGLRMNVFTDTLTSLFLDQSLEGFQANGANVTGIVPGDGNLEVEIYIVGNEGVGDKVSRLAGSAVRPLAVEGGESGNGHGSSYQVQLNPSEAPEPATLTTAGLALAGALAWRRRRRQ
jgi:MYXO-CTERM domain-containing protein